MSTSATGGYLSQTEEALPGGLTLVQTIQQFLVGVTGFDGTLVRPKWQKTPPQMEADPDTNFMTFGVREDTPDANPYTSLTEDGDGSTLQRHVELSVLCSFYGSDCQKNAGNLRDSFHIPQNRDKLTAAKIGFKEISQASFVPEVKGQQWFPRCDVTLTLRREVTKTFNVLSVVSAGGTIEAQKSDDEIENVPWNISEQ